MSDDVVMVVYAYKKDKFSSPWIYGVYQNQEEGFNIMTQMQNSEDYSHLIWSNNIVKVHKEG